MAKSAGDLWFALLRMLEAALSVLSESCVKASLALGVQMQGQKARKLG